MAESKEATGKIPSAQYKNLCKQNPNFYWHTLENDQTLPKYKEKSTAKFNQYLGLFTV